MGKTSNTTSGLTAAVQALRDAIQVEHVMSEADARSAGYVSIQEFGGDMGYDRSRRLLLDAASKGIVESAWVHMDGRRHRFYRPVKGR